MLVHSPCSRAVSLMHTVVYQPYPARITCICAAAGAAVAAAQIVVSSQQWHVVSNPVSPLLPVVHPGGVCGPGPGSVRGPRLALRWALQVASAGDRTREEEQQTVTVVARLRGGPPHPPAAVTDYFTVEWSMQGNTGHLDRPCRGKNPLSALSSTEVTTGGHVEVTGSGGEGVMHAPCLHRVSRSPRLHIL